MNIFAKELVSVLGAHGKELSSLFSLKVTDGYGVERRLLPSKVTRLKRSLTEDLMATLNPDELDVLEDWAGLTPQEVERLRAALVAEAVRYLLAGRIAPDQAVLLGETALQLLTTQNPADIQTLRQQLLDSTRGVREAWEHAPAVVRGLSERPEDAQTSVANGQESVDARVEQALDPAYAALEEGSLWLGVARGTSDRRQRAGYAAQAAALLQRAQTSAKQASGAAQGTAAQQELLDAIAAVLREAEAIG
jgi:hypothetical protein